MAYEFRTTRRVEFADTDMAGIMHYSNFFRFMETAEHAFWRSLGWSVSMPGSEPRLGWPRVHASCDFKRPLRFEDEVEVHLLIQEVKKKSITYAFRFWKLNTTPPAEVARGRLTVACVVHHPDGTMAAVAIPPEVTQKIEPAPPGLLS